MHLTYNTTNTAYNGETCINYAEGYQTNIDIYLNL